MGGAASKPARQFPKAKPTWAGARTPSPSDPMAQAHPARSEPRATETKDQFIQQDSIDPQFAANLTQLGQVNVDHHMKNIKSAEVNQVNRRFQARLQSEEEALSSGAVPNRLLAYSLIDLLERRKQAKTMDELKDLAKQYDIDFDKMENLARFVNNPSVNPASIERTVDKDGSEKARMKAEWVDPPFISKKYTNPDLH